MAIRLDASSTSFFSVPGFNEKTHIESPLKDRIIQKSLQTVHGKKRKVECLSADKKLPTELAARILLPSHFFIIFKDTKELLVLTDTEKKLLADVSDYFKRCFEGCFKESEKRRVHLLNVNREDFQLLLFKLQNKLVQNFENYLQLLPLYDHFLINKEELFTFFIAAIRKWKDSDINFAIQLAEKAPFLESSVKKVLAEYLLNLYLLGIFEGNDSVLQAIKVLDIEQFTILKCKIKNDAFIKLIQHLPHLSSIRFSCTYGIPEKLSNKAYESLFIYLPKLEKIEINASKIYRFQWRLPYELRKPLCYLLIKIFLKFNDESGDVLSLLKLLPIDQTLIQFKQEMKRLSEKST